MPARTFPEKFVLAGKTEFCKQFISESLFSSSPWTPSDFPAPPGCLSPVPRLWWLCSTEGWGERSSPWELGFYHTSANTENTESSLLFVSPSPVRSHKQMTIPKALLKENIKCPGTGLGWCQGNTVNCWLVGVTVLKSLTQRQEQHSLPDSWDSLPSLPLWDLLRFPQ